MLKTFFKKTLLFIIVAIMALTPAITFTAPVYAGTDNHYDEVKDLIEYRSGIESGSDGPNNYHFSIKYDSKRDALSFEFLEYDYYSASTQVARNMTLKVDTNPYFRDEADITIEYKDSQNSLNATANCNLTTLKTSKTLKFTIKDGKGKDCSSKRKLQKCLRDIFDRGMSSWDSVICDITGYHLNDIGMDKYKLNTKNIIHHDAEWVCSYCGQIFTSEAAIYGHFDDLEKQMEANVATHEVLSESMHRYTYIDPELEEELEVHCDNGFQGRPFGTEYTPKWDGLLAKLEKIAKKKA